MIINNNKKSDTENFRKSIQREKILSLLKSTSIHPTADWIYGELKNEFPKLSPGTVYRNLSILLKQNKIKKIRNGSTFDRFEANMSNHYHLICEYCNSITDIEIPECKNLIESAKSLTNFLIRDHNVEFYGICSRCNSKID